jgi:hypothetical protein
MAIAGNGALARRKQEMGHGQSECRLARRDSLVALTGRRARHDLRAPYPVRPPRTGPDSSLRARTPV